MRQRQFAALIAATVTAAATATFALAAPLEVPKPKDASLFLGPTVIGSNYKVKPVVRSDGMMRIFNVETAYGEFQFDGVEFTKMRLRELDAVAALEKMSQSDEFGKAFGRAALAPIQFGANLLTDPINTVNRSVSGVANMFDRAGASLANTRSDRDSIAESLLGVSDTQRQLAVELGVDPYTDFPPLAQRLKQMAGAMAGGSLPVRAGLAFIPGGVGIAISSASSVESVKDTLRNKTAAQIITQTRGVLQSLEVPSDSIDHLLQNQNYTPTDLLIMAQALARIGAQNTAAFVDSAAADATTRDIAFYERQLAVLMAARNGALGGIAAFTIASGQPIALRSNGSAVAVFPLDDLAWTQVPSRAFVTTTAALKSEQHGEHPVLATTGTVTPLAASEIRKLGWKIEHIKPLP